MMPEDYTEERTDEQTDEYYRDLFRKQIEQGLQVVQNIASGSPLQVNPAIAPIYGMIAGGPTHPISWLMSQFRRGDSAIFEGAEQGLNPIEQGSVLGGLKEGFLDPELGHGADVYNALATRRGWGMIPEMPQEVKSLSDAGTLGLRTVMDLASPTMLWGGRIPKIGKSVPELLAGSKAVPRVIDAAREVPGLARVVNRAEQYFGRHAPKGQEQWEAPFARARQEQFASEKALEPISKDVLAAEEGVYGPDRPTGEGILGKLKAKLWPDIEAAEARSSNILTDRHRWELQKELETLDPALTEQWGRTQALKDAEISQIQGLMRELGADESEVVQPLRNIAHVSRVPTSAWANAEKELASSTAKELPFPDVQGQLMSPTPSGKFDIPDITPPSRQRDLFQPKPVEDLMNFVYNASGGRWGHSREVKGTRGEGGELQRVFKTIDEQGNRLDPNARVATIEGEPGYISDISLKEGIDQGVFKPGQFVPSVGKSDIYTLKNMRQVKLALEDLVKQSLRFEYGPGLSLTKAAAEGHPVRIPAEAKGQDLATIIEGLKGQGYVNYQVPKLQVWGPERPQTYWKNQATEAGLMPYEYKGGLGRTIKAADQSPFYQNVLERYVKPAYRAMLGTPGWLAGNAVSNTVLMGQQLKHPLWQLPRALAEGHILEAGSRGGLAGRIADKFWNIEPSMKNTELAEQLYGPGRLRGHGLIGTETEQAIDQARQSIPLAEKLLKSAGLPPQVAGVAGLVPRGAHKAMEWWFRTAAPIDRIPAAGMAANKLRKLKYSNPKERFNAIMDSAKYGQETTIAPQNMTPTEWKIKKNFMPFYPWISGITRNTASQAFYKPHRFAQTDVLLNSMFTPPSPEERQDIRPRDLLTDPTTSIPGIGQLGEDEEGNQLTYSLGRFLPQNTVQALIREFPGTVLGSLNPALTSALEGVSNRQIWSRQPISGGAEEKTSLGPGNILRGLIYPMLGKDALVTQSRYGLYGSHPSTALDWAQRKIPGYPQQRVIDKALRYLGVIPSGPYPELGYKEAFADMLTGVGMRAIRPDRRRMELQNEYRTQKGRLMSDLKAYDLGGDEAGMALTEQRIEDLNEHYAPLLEGLE